MIAIQPTRHLSAQHWQLYLMADPERAVVQCYLPKCQLWEIHRQQKLVGVMALQPLDKETLEIKNLAVMPAERHQGLGSRLIHWACRCAQQGGYRRIIVGTGTTSIHQLLLYQQCGFRVTGIRPDFFVDHYRRPIWENGVRLRDMLVLAQNLSQ